MVVFVGSPNSLLTVLEWTDLVCFNQILYFKNEIDKNIFSRMKFTKTFLKNFMNNDRLSNIAVLSIENTVRELSASAYRGFCG